MTKLFRILFAFSLLASSFNGFGKVRVLTTTTNLKSLVEYVGGQFVDVESFSKGTQDPHYVEAKPSYTLKASRADLVVSIGLDLEAGWLPLILRGARNPSVLMGKKGNLVAGEFIDTIGKITTPVSRADGDVHPEGNPHFLLDPVSALSIAKQLKDKLIQLDEGNASEYESNFKTFSDMLNHKIKEWKKRISVGTKVISYHKTLTYFYHRFGISNIALLEPKPGVPPSASHILGVIKTANQEKVSRVIVENYFDPTVAKRVAKDVKGLSVKVIPVSVEGEPKILTLVDLYERLVSTFEGSK